MRAVFLASIDVIAVIPLERGVLGKALWEDFIWYGLQKVHLLKFVEKA